MSQSRQHKHPEAPQATPLPRRDFLELMGASLAMAGIAPLGGCLRKPREKIVPFSRRPEDLVPGKPRYYATAAQVTGAVVGLLVESQDGRPTKIEGNPRHPMSRGATDALTQASILDLYDPQRPRHAQLAGRTLSPAAREAEISKQAARLAESAGRGLALLVQDLRSPTFHALLRQLRATYPHARVYLHDAAHPRHGIAGSAMVGAAGVRPLFAIDRAERIVALDCDLLGLEGDAVHNAHLFARRRRVRSTRHAMNRLYAIEPNFTVTGMNADHRLRLPASQIGEFLADLVGYVGSLLPAPPAAATSFVARYENQTDNPRARWIKAVGDDLLAHRQRGLVVVGERQPPRVHALGYLLNAMLENIGRTLLLMPDLGDRSEPIEELARELKAGKVETLVVIGGNPAYDAPADLKLPKLMRRVPQSIYLCPAHNETAALCKLVIPQSHYLEAWGDLRSTDGTLAIQQPLIAPLFESLSPVELLARLLALDPADGYSLVRRHFAGTIPAVQPVKLKGRVWRRALHNGARRVATQPITPTFRWDTLATAWARREPEPTGMSLELIFQLDSTLYDGRFAGNAWLQELPNPVTKLTWDNAALVGVATARRLDLASEQVVELRYGERTLETAVWVTPGVAEDCIVLPLGYGRSAGGPVAEQRGFNAFTLRRSQAPSFGQGVTLTRRRGKYQLATTQRYGTQIEPLTGHKREIAIESSLDTYRRDPRFVERSRMLPDSKIKSTLWDHPNKADGQQWGMSIDLGTCIGCNACTIACQAENSIPVVGKERVLAGREMHWIRLDRYFSGDSDDVESVTQPMACQHCETAPCESVCPVAATVHSPEGLNDMAYNRCVGTRYCSNNCPYKVRRFNFFNYQKECETENPLLELQRNPDVTVRFRGVMEKCTYCVQRINSAKIAAKVEGKDKVDDGAIVPACQQVCPTEAIVFGDVNDPNSQVSRLKQLDHDYAVLADMNLQPRTTYVAKLRNPNPQLA